MTTIVPWDYSTPAEGTPSVANVPTPEGADLGREMARLADLEEERSREEFPDQLPRCDDCALKLGTGPNQCTPTLMDVIKCVAENNVFYCHKGIADGQAPKRACRGFLLLVTADHAVKVNKRLEWEHQAQPWKLAMGVPPGKWFEESKPRELTPVAAREFVQAFAKKSPTGCARAVAADGTIIERRRSYGSERRSPTTGIAEGFAAAVGADA